MPSDHTRTPGSKVKPPKPYPGFPLTAHPTGQWCEKIRGKLRYFGKWEDPQAALAKYLKDKDALNAGKVPRGDPESVTVKQAANAFLNHKLSLANGGELSPLTYAKYQEAVEMLAPYGRYAVAELTTQLFAKLRRQMADKWGLYRLGDMIQSIRSIFKFALDDGLIDKPVRFGPGFARPTKKTLRLHQASQGPNLFSADTIRQLIDAAEPNLRAMIYLGINCGFGNSDCAGLPAKAVDLVNGVIDFARPKTGVARLCPLWPETIEALRAVRDRGRRPNKETDAFLFFITRLGASYRSTKQNRPVRQTMRKLIQRLGINVRRGQGFYTLRHTFRTVADESMDQPAVDHIMGHGDQTMASFYRHGLSIKRLRAVTEHVRHWLFPEAYERTAAS